MGYRSLAFTDIDGIYGIARAYRHLIKCRQKDPTLNFKLRYGTEIHLQPDHEKPLIYQNTLALLALNFQGYRHLCQILNRAHHDHKTGAFIPLQDLVNLPSDEIVALQPMRGLIRTTPQIKDLYPRLKTLQLHFKDRFYLVVSRHLSPAEDHWITPTLTMAHELKIPILISQDLFFHHQSQKPLSDVVTAIRQNKPISAIPEQLFINALRSPQPLAKIHQIYAQLPGYRQALENARILDQKFNFELSELRYHYPQEFIPDGHTPHSYLSDRTWHHAHRHYGDTIPEKVSALLKHELALIQQLDFADYFLTVYDIVNWARDRHILCQGRGSAANSAVCFVLGITAIDPAYFDLLFERFISVERGDPPDIDVDFEHERREEVIQYIYQRYGRDKAAMVCNVICFKTKGALRFVGKALGIPESALDRAAQIRSSRAMRHTGSPDTVQLVKEEWQQKHDPAVPDHLWSLWGELAQRIKGFPRHLGIHSGGFLVSDQPLNQICPIEPATMPGRSVIVWCKEDIEGLGFFKIDVLSLGGLTMIRKCFDTIQQYYGQTLTLQTIPADDTPTYRMIQAGDTIGTFQIESRAQIAFLPRHRPRHFYDLVVQVAIIRPGPIQGGMIGPYLRRRNGEEPVTFPDSRLEPILKRTFGVPIFQEQVMRIAMTMGDFSPGEANELRKNIGAFTLRAEPDQWLNRLETSMRQKGVDPTFIQTIIGHIQGFASYGFPESHATSFAILAYVTAYLKCHYPTAFFAAILNSQPMGFYDPDTLIKTAQHLGVLFLPICILNSQWDHQLEALNTPGHYAIRLGFRLVHGLAQSRALKMIQYRDQILRNSQRPTRLQFLSHSHLHRSDITALAAANALAAFGLNRREALWLAEAIPVSDWCESPETPIAFEPETDLEKVQIDYDATHTSLGPHPTALIKRDAWCYPIPLSKLKTAHLLTQLRPHERLVTVFGMITCRQSPPTAKGMVFITIWDETGAVNLVIRPNIYMKYRKPLDDQSFICVTGMLQVVGQSHSVLVQHVYTPTTPQADIRHLDTPIISVSQNQSHFANARNYF